MMELKPCPFCGGRATTSMLRNEEMQESIWQVICLKSLCAIFPANTKTEQEAISAWNRRANVGISCSQCKHAEERNGKRSWAYICNLKHRSRHATDSCELAERRGE
jgi:Lar family restriction alleviation protein